MCRALNDSGWAMPAHHGFRHQFHASAARQLVEPAPRHSHEDEFVYVLEGELTLIEDDGETLLRAGDCAAIPKGTGNGHHMINKSDGMAIYLEVGSRQPADITTCSDVDLPSTNADGRFVHKDGTPYD